MIVAGLTLIAFFALAAAMPRHALALLGAWERRIPPPWLRTGGWALLALAFVIALGTRDAGLTLVLWFGLLPVAAAAVLLGLTYDARLARGGVAAGVVLLAAGLVGVGAAHFF